MQSDRLRSARGAVLLHVAIGFIALFAFSMFVVDYGLMWVSRHEAQNAADGGALAGAVALAYDAPAGDLSNTGPAYLSAQTVAQTNHVWGTGGVVNVTFPLCPDGTNTCIRVDVFRNEANGNPLPMWFGQILGMNTQGTRAMAMAQAAMGNANNCIMPFAIPDRWCDVYDTTNPTTPACTTAANAKPAWTLDDTYDEVYPNGPNKGTPLPNPDWYVSPLNNPTPGTTTGFTVGQDFGTRIRVKAGNPGGSQYDPPKPGFYFLLDLPVPGGGTGTGASGGSGTGYFINHCNGVAVEAGDALTIENGVAAGPINAGIDELIASDPTAYWDGTGVADSCVSHDPPDCPNGYTGAVSPRIRPVPLYDPHEYAQVGSGKNEVVIVNILGFFIEQRTGQDIYGYLVSTPGVDTGSSTISSDASFLKTVTLLR